MTRRNPILAETGPYWTLPLPVYPLELHPALLHEIEGREDSSAFEAYMLMIFDDVASHPSGIMEIVVNPQTRRACALYEAKRPSRPLSRRFSNDATKPLWLKARTAQQAANKFYRAIVEQAHEI